MKRDITQLFSEWKQRENRKPLLLRGARQVGKTYAVEQFAKDNFDHYLKVNLEEQPELKSLFRKNNTKTILDELSVLFKTSIEPGKTLFFIDEIQSCPEALVTLRYFYEQLPALHVIAAGSLLDHTLNEMKLSMPVGRIEFCHMHPLSFKEFLWAMEEIKLADYLEKYTLNQEVSEPIHKKLLDLLRYYLFIGGMPEAVNVYAETRKLMDVERVHSSILTSLQYDFAKYGTRSQQQHLISVLKYIGQHPGSRIKYVNIEKEVRAANLKEAIRKLEMSRVVHLAKHSGSQGVPLSKHVKEEVYKAIFLDVGLSNSLNKIQLTDPLKILTLNEGAVAEQFAGQELLTLPPAYYEPALFYWVREEKSAAAEVDFLFQHNNKVIPIEVKAGKTGTLKSLHVYLFEKKIKTGVRFNTDTPSFGAFRTKVRSGTKSGDLNYYLLSLPLYMINQMPRLLDEIEL
jgi:predicted AAA+ superfamily ATPase